MHRCWRRAAAEAHSLFLAVLCLLLVAEKVYPETRPETPASDAFGQWVQQNVKTGNTAGPKALALGLDLAQQRRVEMRRLMEANPQAFLERAMTDGELASLPPQMQPLVEKRVKGRGLFGVYCAGLPRDARDQAPHAAPSSGYAYEARVNGVTYRAFVVGKWREQATALDAEIEGLALDDAIVLSDAPTPTEQAANGQPISAASPSTTGPNTLLYMIARFSDESTDPVADATVLSQMTVVSNFWMNNSSGTVSIHGLANPNQVVDIVHITLPQPMSYGPTYNNNFSQILSDARNAAAALGYNYSSYNLDVVVTSDQGFSYAGKSWIAAQGSHWVAPYTSLRTAGHELGHNLGLYHANYWRTDSTQPFGKDSNPGGYVADKVNGEWIEYGHYFSVMSAQFGGEWDDATKPHYAPAEKVRLGWLAGSQVQYVSASGTYRLFRLDALSTVGTPRGIRIETAATDYTGYARHYWLSYRYAPWSTAQSWFQNGIEVDVAQTGYGSDGSIMLDMSPYSKDQSSPFYDSASPPGSWWTIDNSDKIDGALVVGRTYDDVSAGIHMTPVATGNNGSGEEFIDVVVNLGSFAGNRAPIITVLTASTNQVAPNQSINFNVTATDPDGDALAYSWDFDQVQTWMASGLNSPTATKSWSAPGQYRVLVRVSDMKGGVSTASTIVTVGTPANTREIWGRVLWAGRPVYNARVSTTSGSTVYQAWTQTDGTYVLTDLSSANSYAINCAAAALTFTPQFQNPVPANGTNVYGADFYADQPSGGGSSSGLAISGQVKDPVNGAAGIEVRAGGMVVTTDSSGNFSFGNFPNGTYTVVPQLSGWAFSPSNRIATVASADSTGNNFSRVAPYTISGTFSGIPAGSQSPAPAVYLSNGRSVIATRAGSGPNRYWTYTLNNAPAGQFSVTAELSGYNLVPSGFSNPLAVSGNISGANFVGNASGNIAGAISGRITQNGLPLAGAVVSATQSGANVATATTDSDGYYRLDELSNGSFTLSAAKTGFSFSPPSLAVSSVPSSRNDFTASAPGAPPVISSLTAQPSVLTSSAETTVLSAVASGTGILTYSWDAVVAPGPVTFSANDSSAASSTTVAFQAAGSYSFRARVVDGNGLSTNGTVNVAVSAGPGTMAIAPYQVQVAGGQSVAFRADAWDQLGNPITASPTWSVSGGGTIDSSGLFYAVSAGGPYIVTAGFGGLSATSSVWVTSSAATSLPFSINSITSSNGILTLTWNSIPGRTYYLEYKDNLSDLTWTSLPTDIVANSSTASSTVPVAGGQRFFRVSLLP
jgi:hypothetical protein